MRTEPVLVTGATGYVGGRLVPRLLESGHKVRVIGRSIDKLASRPWSKEPGIEMVRADVLDNESLRRAVRGCPVIYYLVHSMNANQKNFAEADRKAARNMVQAAGEAGVARIIFLGGLGEADKTLSHHLKSRAEVAKIFQDSGIPTTYLRAAMILGSGSASFEILRYLVEHLPVMTTPRWVRNPVQPIAISNVLRYLQGCLDNEETAGQTYDIGGPDVLSYQDLMGIYAGEAGLARRLIIPVPVLTPRLSSYWIHLVTPVPSYIARPLAEGLRNPVICHDNRIKDVIPQTLLSCRETIKRALGRIQEHCVDTCWMDAGDAASPEKLHSGDAPYAGGTLLRAGYRVIMDAGPAEVWRPISALGGRNGWYSYQWLWKIRGAIDRILGGPGLRRGRPERANLLIGDAVDFFRVLKIEPHSHLQLLAEMKTPGEAVLDFILRPLDNGNTELQQVSRFVPHGLFGLLYWHALLPLHNLIFRRMLKTIADEIGRTILRGPEPIK